MSLKTPQLKSLKTPLLRKWSRVFAGHCRIPSREGAKVGRLGAWSVCCHLVGELAGWTCAMARAVRWYLHLAVLSFLELHHGNGRRVFL